MDASSVVRSVTLGLVVFCPPVFAGAPADIRRELVLQAPPAASVNSVAVSPDGSLVDTAAGEGGIRLYDAQTGRLLRTLGKAGDRSVVFSPDGRTVTAGGFHMEKLVELFDVQTGRTSLNWDLVFKAPGERHIVCYWNTRSYWPTAYHPGTNSIYTSYIDNCRDLTLAGPAGRGSWKVVPRPGSDPNAQTGLAKINMATGEILRFNIGRAPGNGALLATAGDVVFHGDMNRRFRAFDAENGKLLWESILGGNISVSTITYAVNGKQYIAVMTGDNLKVPELAAMFPEIKTPRGNNAIYAFALP